MDKIRKKGGPKEYKTGPRASGFARLRARAATLSGDAKRFASKKYPPDSDEEAAYQLHQVLVDWASVWGWRR